MSFSSSVKAQLAELAPDKKCCKNAENYALLLYSGLFSARDARYVCKHRCSAEKLAQCIAECGAFAELKEYRAREQEQKRFEVTLSDESEREKLRNMLYLGGDRLNDSFISNECCRRAFLRGAFLVSGTVVNPQKGYNLEICAPDSESAVLLKKVLKRQKINSGTTDRRSSQTVYVKELESVQNALALMGAGNAYLELLSVSIERELRNDTNRRVNCDKANLEKQTDAAVLQREAIIKVCGGENVEILPEELREVAALRLENPEMSLRELAGCMSEPISHSAVARRLRRIVELATLAENSTKE